MVHEVFCSYDKQTHTAVVDGNNIKTPNVDC